MNAAENTFLVKPNVLQIPRTAGKYVYKFNRTIAWPAAWICYNFQISSNLVTCTRFTSPLVFISMALNGAALWQYLAVVAFFAYTDAVDGVLAGSNFEDKPHDNYGTMLDPLADKFLIISAYLYHYNNFPRLVIITIVGEALIALLALSFIAAVGTIAQMRANMWGKTKMFFEVVTIGLMTWYYAARSAVLDIATMITGATVIFFLMGSFYSKARKILP